MCPFCYHNGGSLLHCLSTLTFTKKAVYFCCTGLGVTSTGRYPASCPMKPGLSSSAPFRLYSRDHLTCLRKCYSNTIFPLSKGFYFTVIRHFTVLLPDFTVIIAFPFFLAMILPLEETVAIFLLLDFQEETLSPLARPYIFIFVVDCLLFRGMHRPL